ncbi:ketoacyl-ACP synthase III family protein [Streptomyces sp. NPDC021093]|uniref:ketoacyl-ACP synthase III family protein n=1 Tax=Streptomyces sp. NPDC021093 TaxID=3365112 RepID=UPI00379ADED2
MRYSPAPYVRAATTWLPPGADTAENAVAESRADARRAAADGYAQLPVSQDLSGPEMAVLAAEKALADAGLDGAEVGVALHAWIYHQGHDFWSPAHYVAQRAGADNALPLGIQQMCNGGAAAIDTAAVRFAADPGLRSALVTTGDRFASPGFDRWSGDFGVAYGDGATAWILDRSSGPYRLRALHTVPAPALEAMHRGHDAFSPAPRAHGSRVDVRRTKKAFLADGGGTVFETVAADSVRRALLGALDDARLGADDPRISHLVLPRLGRTVLDRAYLPGVAATGLAHLDVLTPGSRTGHLGAGDAAASLAELHEDRRLEPGRVALLLSAGAGFTWSVLVIEAV